MNAKKTIAAIGLTGVLGLTTLGGITPAMAADKGGSEGHGNSVSRAAHTKEKGESNRETAHAHAPGQRTEKTEAPDPEETVPPVVTPPAVPTPVETAPVVAEPAPVTTAPVDTTVTPAPVETAPVVTEPAPTTTAPVDTTVTPAPVDTTVAPAPVDTTVATAPVDTTVVVGGSTSGSTI